MIRLPRPAAPVPDDVAASVIPSGWGTPRPQPQSEMAYPCRACGGRFAADDVYEEQGTYVCRACFDRSVAAGSQATAATCAGCGTALGQENLHEVGGQWFCEACAMGAAVQAAAPSATGSPSYARPRPKSSPGWIAWAIGGGVAAVVLISAIVIARSSNDRQQLAAAPPTISRPPSLSTLPSNDHRDPAPVDWEKANATKIHDLQWQALSLQADGHYAEADKKYQELFHLTEGRKPSWALQSQLAEARSAWDDVKVKLHPTRPGPGVGPVAIRPDEPTTRPAPTSPAGPARVEAHRDELNDLLAQAEQLSRGPDKLKTLLKYKQLVDLLGSRLHDVQDPALKQKLSAALETRKQLLAQLKLSDESRLLTAGALVSAGYKALSEQKWPAALESLSDARNLIERAVKLVPQRAQNEEYLAALEGSVVVYLKTKQVQKAGELLDGREVLGKKLENDPPRELLADAAMCDIVQRTKAMRTAKAIRAWLEKHGNPNDELMLDLLGTALNTAGEQVQVAELWKQTSAYYTERNAAIEKTRPGQKRWGVEWMPAAQADENFAKRNAAIGAWQQKVREENAALKEFRRIEDLARPRFNGRVMVRYATDAQVADAKAAYEARVREAKTAKAAIPSLPWLKEFDPVLPPRAVQLASATTSPPPTFVQPTSPTPPPSAQAELPPTVALPASVERYALAFPIDRLRLVTAAAPLQNATQVRLTDADGLPIPATVVAKGHKLAVLEVQASAIESGALRYLNLGQSFTGGPVRCAAIPEQNLFAPSVSLIPGQAAPSPPQGEWDINLEEHPRLAGSPLLSAQGDVIGVAIPASRDDPRTKLPAIALEELRSFLRDQHALPAAPCANPDPRAVYQVTVEE